MTNTTNSVTAAAFTPYDAAKFVNQVLTEAGLPSVPPQMMYNYTTARINKGKAPLIKCDASGAIKPEDLLEWLAKYLEKKGIQVTPKTEEVEEIEEDYVI